MSEPEIQKTWERQNAEKDNHYSWFHRYLMMGSARSLLGAYSAAQEEKGRKKQNRVAGAWIEASVRHSWRERAAVWDAEQRKKTEIEYEEQRRALAKRKFAAKEQAMEKIETMLRFPIVSTRTTGNTTIIEPAKWTFDTIPRLMAMIDNELANEDETTIKVTHRNSGENDSSDDDDANDRRATAIVAILERGRARRDRSADS